MTGEQVDMDTPDNLVLLDTNAVDTSMATLQDESDRTPDDQSHDFNPPADHPPHPPSDRAGSNPVPYQDGSKEICSSHIQEDTDLVLIQPSVIDNDKGDLLKDTSTFLHSEHQKPADHEAIDISINLCASSESHEIRRMQNNAETPLINIDHDMLNISTHASLMLDPLSLINNVLETADGSDNNNSAILTLNNTSPDNFVFPAVDSCTSFVAQTTLNLVIDIESDGKPATCSSDLPIDILITDHSDNMTVIQEIVAKSERDPSQTPDNTGDLGHHTEEAERVSLKFTGTKRDGEVCNETWLDACQFLAGEEDGGAILDQCGRSLSPSPPQNSSDNTKASGFPMRDNISIDQHAEKRELFPTVERWSSTDSWASALSDWFQVSTYTEDSFTSTNTDSKLGMAIQDTSVEQRTNPNTTNPTGQTSAGEALDTELDKCDNNNGKQGDKDCIPAHSDSDRQSNVIVEDKVNLQEPVVERECHMTEMKAVLDAFNAELPCGSPGSDFSVEQCGRQHVSGELWSAKLEGDAHLRLDFKEVQDINSGAQRISVYTSDKNLTANHTSDADLHTCPPQSSSHVSSEVERTQGVETDEKCVSRSFIEGDGLYDGSNAGDVTVKPAEEFIMPFAPLSPGNTFLHRGVLKEDVPHTGVDVPLQGIINEIKPFIKSSQKSSKSEDSSEDLFTDRSLSLSCGDSDDPSMKNSWRKQYSNYCDISKELSNLILLTGEHFMVSDKKRVAYVTLDLDEPRRLSFSNHVNSENCSCVAQDKPDKMPHKTSKTSPDGKARSKHKEKQSDQHMLKMQEKPTTQEKRDMISKEAGCEDRAVTVIETIVITEKITPKAQGKKKKKHTKPETDPPTEVRNRTVQKNTNSKAENLEVKVASNGLDKPASHLSTKVDTANKNSTQKPMTVRPKAGAKMIPDNTDTGQKTIPVKPKPDTSGINVAKMENKTCTSDPQSTCLSGTINDDVKRRRIANDLSGTIPVRTRPQLPAIFRQARKDGEDVTRKAYSEVVKQKTPAPKEVVVPRVVSEIQAEPVPADPQNISLWCRFSSVPPDAAIKWTKEGTVLSEKKGERDDDRFTLTILKASSKDLGLYKCSLSTSSISVFTSEYHLTSEVLMELVIPSHNQPAEPRLVEGNEESIQCSPLLFKEDFLSDQYFGENQAASIVTEKAHFGEGMHRKAFRTTLRASKLPSFYPGHPCVLKVHNSISYGTKDNDELIQRNYSLAVEECHVQNTAREYIKAYHNVARSAKSFGEVPEIIPIYLVHRPSNDIPYATLEEELLGDFVKYSVKDGKEINLMRRDSEAGQKCCAFQHWVYNHTEGNLLVTDMQGVGMKLTDVGIATCKKGYKGFRGNCATSFIDQFKALHQCNTYCELLGLKSLQPKPKRTVPPKPKAQPGPKKNPFGSVLNGKS